MLRSIQATVFADLDDALVQRWQYPVPVNQLHLVEAAVMEWNVQRSSCRKLGRFIVDDPAVAKASLEQLLGGSPVVKKIIDQLELQYGTKLTVQQILDRIAVDSGTWLAVNNASAVASGNGTVGAAAAAMAVAANAAALTGPRGRASGGRGQRRSRQRWWQGQTQRTLHGAPVPCCRLQSTCRGVHLSAPARSAREVL